MTSPKKSPPDLYIAFKALAVAHGLSRNEARVAGALLAHFNIKSGQCDPSVSRLGTMLGIARSKVLKATSSLCSGAARLFDKQSHGGKSHRASYTPKWDRFAEIVVDWETRMSGPLPQGPSKGDVGAGANGPQSRDVDGPQKGDVNGPQKGDTNSLKELFEGTLSAREQKLSAGVDRPKGLRRDGANPPTQRSIIYPIPGGKFLQQASRADAAREQAKRRISDQIMGTDIEAWLAADDPRNLFFDAAVNQEIYRRGHGLRWLQDRMMNQRSSTRARP
ncbi:hypothetical protein [Mesorhizobium sp. CO1-1-9]|uniref:hypothetical protein n=1 Tax=Mesorhizobium sp. CO1-1-9 TaxID=2876630 RepID=UPI001CCF9482|nr:hypothetical protein [Mesorhizobium sp. CO1-1-9]MBZ9695507.1 hypothetical protein [Mesorhizobium sp. CO1-1-9]